VQWERDGAFVWHIVDRKVEKAAVRVVERSIDRLLLTSDQLKMGDSVVVEGTQSVREGGEVEVRGTPKPPAAPASDDGVPAAENPPAAPAGRADAGPATGQGTRSADARQGTLAR
jgi:hypothetical protein